MDLRNSKLGKIMHSKKFPPTSACGGLHADSARYDCWYIKQRFNGTCPTKKYKFIVQGNKHRYREYVYSAVVYQKYLTSLRELIIFEPWRENYHFSQPS